MIVKLWLAALGVSSASVAVHVTVVAPMANVDPEAGAHATVAAGLSPASSTALGAASVTTAPLGLLALVVMLGGLPARPSSRSSVTAKSLLSVVRDPSAP